MTNVLIILAGGVVVNAPLAFFLMFAEVTTTNWPVLIGQFGLSAVLAFFLLKLEPRLKAIEDAIRDSPRMKAIEDGLHALKDANAVLARAMLVLAMGIRQANEATKETAREELAKIDRKYPPHDANDR